LLAVSVVPIDYISALTLSSYTPVLADMFELKGTVKVMPFV